MHIETREGLLNAPQVYETRTITAHAIANQFYGCFITTEKWSDQWLKKGISKYLAGLFVKKMFGNNEYRDMIHKEMERVVRYEDRYGGIALDSHIPPQTVTPVRGRPERDDRVNVEDNFAFDPSNLNSCSPEWLEVRDVSESDLEDAVIQVHWQNSSTHGHG